MNENSRTVRDPICGKEVDTLRARAVGIYGGVTYYFCSAECKAKYVDPRKNPVAPRTDGPERRAVLATAQPQPSAPEQAPAPAAAAQLAPEREPSLAEQAEPDEESGLDLPPEAKKGSGRSVLYAVLGLAAGAGVLFMLLH
jgi:YHS domain-containing protein